MGPATLQLYAARSDLRDALASAQHWSVGQAFMSHIDEMVSGLAEQAGESSFRLGKEFAYQLDLPGPNVVLEMTYRDVVVIAHFMRMGASQKLRLALQIGGGDYSVSGIFMPGSSIWNEPFGGIGGQSSEVITGVAVYADLIFALASEPRLVRKTPPTRQRRRHVQRAIGFVPAVWTDVSWTVGEAVTPAGGEGHPDHGQPLHVVRAHWRKYPHATQNAVQRPGRKGWWVWVRHHFRGHPDFGIRLHRYKPKLGEASADVVADVRAAATLHARAAIIKDWEVARG